MSPIAMAPLSSKPHHYHRVKYYGSMRRADLLKSMISGSMLMVILKAIDHLTPGSRKSAGTSLVVAGVARSLKSAAVHDRHFWRHAHRLRESQDVTQDPHQERVSRIEQGASHFR